MRARRIIIPIAFIGLLVACGTGSRPPSAPSPDGAHAPGRPLPPHGASLAPYRMIRVCAVQGGALTDVAMMYNPLTGDTSFGTPSWPVTVPPFAVDQPWFVHNEPITLGEWRYVKYGRPRAFRAGELVRAADYRGVPVFAERGDEKDLPVVYLPLRNFCEFQAYHLSDHLHGVRG